MYIVVITKRTFLSLSYETTVANYAPRIPYCVLCLLIHTTIWVCYIELLISRKRRVKINAFLEAVVMLFQEDPNNDCLNDFLKSGNGHFLQITFICKTSVFCKTACQEFTPSSAKFVTDSAEWYVVPGITGRANIW